MTLLNYFALQTKSSGNLPHNMILENDFESFHNGSLSKSRSGFYLQMWYYKMLFFQTP